VAESRRFGDDPLRGVDQKTFVDRNRFGLDGRSSHGLVSHAAERNRADGIFGVKMNGACFDSVSTCGQGIEMLTKVFQS